MGLLTLQMCVPGRQPRSKAEILTKYSLKHQEEQAVHNKRHWTLLTESHHAFMTKRS